MTEHTTEHTAEFDHLSKAEKARLSRAYCTDFYAVVSAVEDIVRERLGLVAVIPTTPEGQTS